ncbi:MAG: flagellum-specific ATP synthase FliI, partial [Lacisediminimonas sp.]|nr:flagellum-specific ATP synthase FliI [Lacisediminimonas sp.]
MASRMLDLQRTSAAIRNNALTRRVGHVCAFFGLIVEAHGPDAFLGEICQIRSRLQSRTVDAEVVGLREGRVLLMPYGELRGIGPGSEVVASGRALRVAVGDALLGRVVDATGKPIDGKPMCALPDFIHLAREPINPLQRGRISEVLETGVRAIDCFLTLGRGQRMGIFSGSGVGKSSLLGMVAKDMRADINVIALIGERGREVQEFIARNLGPEGLSR